MGWLRLRKRSLFIIHKDHVICSFDPTQMKRVFENLIGNAIKHNPDGINNNISLDYSQSKVPGHKSFVIRLD